MNRTQDPHKNEQCQQERAFKKRKLDLEEKELQYQRRRLEFDENEFEIQKGQKKDDVAENAEDVVIVSVRQIHKDAERSTKEHAKDDAAVDSNSALAEVQVLAATFQKEWLPKCKLFIINPPTKAKTRANECQKLSFSLEEHVLYKADEIKVEGDVVAMASRKKLVDEVHQTLKKMEESGDRHSSKY